MHDYAVKCGNRSRRALVTSLSRYTERTEVQLLSSRSETLLAKTHFLRGSVVHTYSYIRQLRIGENIHHGVFTNRGCLVWCTGLSSTAREHGGHRRGCGQAEAPRRDRRRAADQRRRGAGQQCSRIYTTSSARSAAIEAASWPSSRRISSVCSPSIGARVNASAAARPMRTGVSEIGAGVGRPG